MTTKMVVSFGFRYGGPNSWDGDIIDVRKWLNKNPYHDRKLRYLRGTDEAVQLDIEATPGFSKSYKELKARVEESQQEIVYLGCTGGHHRSVYMAERIGAELGLLVAHRDIDRK